MEMIWFWFVDEHSFYLFFHNGGADGKTETAHTSWSLSNVIVLCVFFFYRTWKSMSPLAELVINLLHLNLKCTGVWMNMKNFP